MANEDLGFPRLVAGPEVVKSESAKMVEDLRATRTTPTQKELREGIDLTDYVVDNDFSWQADEDTTGVETPKPTLTLGHPLTNNMGVALLQPAAEASEKMSDSMANLAREMGVNQEGLFAFFEAINAAAAAYTATPKDELRFRLNANLVGEDPGQPVNTGPDGWRI